MYQLGRAYATFFVRRIDFIGEMRYLGVRSLSLLKLPDSCRKIIDDTVIEFTLPTKHHDCPACGSAHTGIDRYRLQTLKGIADTAHIYRYRNRRYRCLDCGKTFSEEWLFIDRYQQIPKSEIDNIVKSHGELMTTAHIARIHGVSSTTVARHFARVADHAADTDACDELFEGAAISLDEFRGNVGAAFQIVVNDLQHRKCRDIIEDRISRSLREALLRILQEYRENVTTVSIDLSGFFRNVVMETFPNAEIAADKFHALRLATGALDTVRRRLIAEYPPGTRPSFASSRRLLLTRGAKLKERDRTRRDLLLQSSEELRRAYLLKEEYFRWFESPDRRTYAARLKTFGEHVERANIKAFKTVWKTTEQWNVEIWHGIESGYNNGFTEGCNNTIKTLK